MIAAMAALLLFQLAGEVLVQLSGIPVPGPVVGMVLLFLALALRGSTPHPLRSVSQALLGHLSLLFVPAGVGVMLYMDRFAAEWPAIVSALLLSTVLTMMVTALVMAGAIRLAAFFRRRREHE